MESHAPHRHNLCHFLLNMLDVKKIKGLEWIRRDKKLFKISWMDKRNQIWANEENIIFKEWEMYNNRYREGESENWTMWKQTFRSALNKSPSVDAIPELYDLTNKLMPYRVYRFTDDIEKRGNPLKMEKKIKSSTKKMKKRADGKESSQSQLHKGSVTLNRLQNHKNFNTAIPKVVADALKNNESPYSEAISANTFGEYKNAAFTDLSIMQQPEAMSTEDTWDVKNIPSPDCDQDLCNNPSLDCDLNLYDAIMMNCDSNSRSKEGPEFEDVLQPSPQQNLGPIPTGTEMSNLFYVKYKVYYANVFICQGFIGNNGVRLFFGSQAINHWPQLFGPDNFSQIELPDVTKCSVNLNIHNDKSMIEGIQKIVGNMKRGLLLYCVNRKLFAFRLCTTRVFATTNEETIVIDRRDKSEQQLFDMDVFEKQLNIFGSNTGLHKGLPSPNVILSFGQPFSLVKNPLVHLELTYLEAENMLKGRNSLIESDLQFSNFDSGDLLIEKFKESLSLKK